MRLALFDLDGTLTRSDTEKEWVRLLDLGGNIYYTSKLAAFHGINFQQLAGLMTGLGEDYRRMMVAGGRAVEGNRYQHEWDARDGKAATRDEEF